MVNQSLVKLDAFSQALAEAKTIPEVKDLLDQADLFRQWLKKQRVGREAQNKGAEMCLMAMRKLGEMLIDGAREPGETDKAIISHDVILSALTWYGLKNITIENHQDIHDGDWTAANFDPVGERISDFFSFCLVLFHLTL